MTHGSGTWAPKHGVCYHFQVCWLEDISSHLIIINYIYIYMYEYDGNMKHGAFEGAKVAELICLFTGEDYAS